MVHGVHSADEPGCRGRLARGGGAVSFGDRHRCSGHGDMGIDREWDYCFRLGEQIIELITIKYILKEKPFIVINTTRCHHMKLITHILIFTNLFVKT